MPLEGLRWSRDSGSALYDTPQTAVLGRAEGGGNQIPFDMRVHNHYCHYELHNIKSRNNFVLFHYLLLISFKSCIFIYHMVNALK